MHCLDDLVQQAQIILFLLPLQIVNKEMFWVVTEICNESNLVKRMKIIKAFIKIASKSFSMFFKLKGLYLVYD